MSTYDKISLELKQIKNRHLLSNVTAGIFITIVIFNIFDKFSVSWQIIAFFPIMTASAAIFHLARKRYSTKYSLEMKKISELELLVSSIRVKVEEIFRKYPSRNKGEQFKRTFELAGKNVRELEESLAVGMAKEGREIFVTAFVRKGVAVRVTASIGSLYQCCAADNPRRWAECLEKLGCDEIRQYHNHPTTSNSTSPSAIDYKTTSSLKKKLGRHASKMRSFIIYWNEIKEWRILEYDETPSHQLVYCFDAAS